MKSLAPTALLGLALGALAGVSLGGAAQVGLVGFVLAAAAARVVGARGAADKAAVAGILCGVFIVLDAGLRLWVLEHLGRAGGLAVLVGLGLAWMLLLTARARYRGGPNHKPPRLSARGRARIVDPVRSDDGWLNGASSDDTEASGPEESDDLGLFRGGQDGS